MRPIRTGSRFTRFAKWTARVTGRPAAFTVACATILVWGITGPVFGFSDTWQLVINTGTTIVTFMMVFLIQNTQNRDSEAIQIKLDELIRAVEGAHNALLDLEELDEEKLERIRKNYGELAARARDDLSRGKDDTGSPPGRRERRHGETLTPAPSACATGGNDLFAHKKPPGSLPGRRSRSVRKEIQFPPRLRPHHACAANVAARFLPRAGPLLSLECGAGRLRQSAFGQDRTDEINGAQAAEKGDSPFRHRRFLFAGDPGVRLAARPPP